MVNQKTGKLSFCDIDNIQIGQFKMDEILKVLNDFHHNNYFYYEDTHVYMHNLFTIKELYKSFDNYQDLITYMKYSELVDSPFNDCGKKIIKQLCQKKNIDSHYLIDNLKKVS